MVDLCSLKWTGSMTAVLVVALAVGEIRARGGEFAVAAAAVALTARLMALDARARRRWQREHSLLYQGPRSGP